MADIFDVSAVSALWLTGTGGAYKTPIEVSASSGLAFSASVDLTTRFWSVSASSGFVIGGRPTTILNQAVSVSASSGLAFAASVDLVTRFWSVSAQNRFTLGGQPATVLNHTLDVSALSTLRFRGQSSAVVGRNYDVSAASRLTLHGVGYGPKDCAATAANSLTLDGQAVAGRVLHVSASTSIGFAAMPRSNSFWGMTAAGSFTIDASATAYTTATLAKSGWILTDLAQATVVFPWRRSPLPLPSGGGQPHS